jgi:hypothetical protein
MRIKVKNGKRRKYILEERKINNGRKMKKNLVTLKGLKNGFVASGQNE